MATISEKTAKHLEENEKWLAAEAAGDKASWVKTSGIIPFVVTLAIGYAIVHFAL